jgi:hypothetical protein
MKKIVDPKEVGLPSKTVIEQVGRDHLAIVISRKSRVIMADGRKILEKAGKIKEAKPRSKVSLRTTAPVCSKTAAFLKENGIDII